MNYFLFETERLRCRQWEVGDLEAIFAVYSDPDAMRWVGEGEPITREQCEQWLTVTAANYEKRGYGMFALEERASGMVVGFCGLVHPGGQEEAEVKYALMRSHWGRGLASEAIPALLDYGHRAHELTEIIATVHPDNLASQRVLVKSGLQKSAERCNDDGSTTLVYTWLAPIP